MVFFRLIVGFGTLILLVTLAGAAIKAGPAVLIIFPIGLIAYFLGWIVLKGTGLDNG